MATPTPAPYPTSGNAVPRTWDCESVQTAANNVAGTGETDYERCAVTSWQATNPEPVNQTTNNNTYEAAADGPGIAESSSYGAWSDDWISFLVGGTFTTALYVLIVGMLFVWAVKAIRS